jgi:hypothetical protein
MFLATRFDIDFFIGFFERNILLNAQREYLRIVSVIRFSGGGSHFAFNERNIVCIESNLVDHASRASDPLL